MARDEEQAWLSEMVEAAQRVIDEAQAAQKASPASQTSKPRSSAADAKTLDHAATAQHPDTRFLDTQHARRMKEDMQRAAENARRAAEDARRALEDARRAVEDMRRGADGAPREASPPTSQPQMLFRPADVKTLELAVEARKYLQGPAYPRYLAVMQDSRRSKKRIIREQRVAQEARRAAAEDALRREAELLMVLRRAKPEEVAAVAKQIMANPEQAARIRKTSQRVRRAGIAGLTPVQLLILVLVWFVLPAAQAVAPGEVKKLISEEVPEIAVAVAITLYVLGQRDG